MEKGEIISTSYEDGVVYCDVAAKRAAEQYTDIPVLRPHPGFIQLPEQGEEVTLEKLDDGSRFISSILHRENSFPNKMVEGELAIHLDGGTEIYFEKQADQSFEINIESGNGDVIIDGIDFDEHVHHYDWSDPAGSSDTDPPKNP